MFHAALGILFERKSAAVWDSELVAVSIGDSEDKDSACNAGDLGSIPGFGRFPGEGNSYPCQYSCLENSMNRGAWQATVHRVTELDITG